MRAIDKELNKVAKLLLLEKEEDLMQYKQKMAGSSISERRKTGVCWYPVNIERTSFSAGERLLIRVSRPKEHKESHLFQSGKPVSLFSNSGSNNEIKSTVNGVINSLKKHEMLITLNCDNEPEWLRDRHIGIQLLFDENTYSEMFRALKIVINTEDQRLLHLKEVLLSNTEAVFNDQETEENTILDLAHLNNSQYESVRLVERAKDVAIIHGPPGTGKTTTLVYAIKQSLKREQQVMICAPGNAAVDLLIEKLRDQELNILRIGHPARVTDEILDLTIDAKLAKHDSYKTLRAIKKQAEETYQMAHKYKRSFGSEERQQRRLLLQESNRLKYEAEQLEHYIVSDLLSKAQIIACTMVGASNYRIRDRHYSTVFIDEAGQGMEPAAWIPITKANRVIFAGDHLQLPPTIKSYAAAKQGLDETLFEKVIKRNKADIMLREQYRMHENIMNFSNNFFYNNKLYANSNVKNHLIYKEDTAIEFIDTAGCGFFEQTDKKSKSTYNTEEADILLKHFLAYMNILTNSIKTESDNKISIGIISPYKAQIAKLQSIFEGIDKELNIAVDTNINTVDSFQGQERDIVYLSLVRSNDKNEIGFLKDYRRMNVALTRAKKKLVVIGDSATIGNDKFYSQFIDYINNINAYRSAFEFMY